MPNDAMAFTSETQLGPVNSRMRKEQVRRYFRSTPDPTELFWARALMVGGAVLLVAGLAALVFGYDLLAAALGGIAVIAAVQARRGSTSTGRTSSGPSRRRRAG